MKQEKNNKSIATAPLPQALTKQPLLQYINTRYQSTIKRRLVSITQAASIQHQLQKTIASLLYGIEIIRLTWLFLCL